MLQKTKTFLEVARLLSFTEAAYVLGVSQSAVSQNVAALERELGIKLIERTKRKIALTPTGSRFATEANRILCEFDELVTSIRKMNVGCTQSLRIAYLNVFRGRELEKAIVDFSAAYPDTAIDMRALSHEEIYEALCAGLIDIALSDQRRAFSEDFENIVLAETPIYAELAVKHPLTSKKRLAVSDLKNENCILVAPKAFQDKEESYYAGFLGFKGQFLFAETLGAARLMASGGRGFLLYQGNWLGNQEKNPTASTLCVPLFKSGRLVKERFCAFYLKTKRSKLIEAFSTALKCECKQNCRGNSLKTL